MAIHVRLVGELPPVWLPVVPEDSVAEAVSDAAELWEKDPESVRLTLGEVELNDHAKSLADYGVTIDDVLVMTVKE
jgi:hypothetical protein